MARILHILQVTQAEEGCRPTSARRSPSPAAVSLPSVGGGRTVGPLSLLVPPLGRTPLWTVAYKVVPRPAAMALVPRPRHRRSEVRPRRPREGWWRRGRASGRSTVVHERRASVRSLGDGSVVARGVWVRLQHAGEMDVCGEGRGSRGRRWVESSGQGRALN